jgi:hypothetical protein
VLDVFHILLYLHVLGAIIAFGPGFTSPVAVRLLAREPQFGNFYARLQVLTARAIVIPVAISMAVAGVGMILVRGWDVVSGDRFWLETSIALYAVALGFSLFVQGPAGARLVALSSTPPAPGTAPAPELRAVARRVGRGGIFLSVMVLIITFLMVVKPF